MENLKWLKSRQDATFESKKVGSSEGKLLSAKNEKCHCEEGERPTWQSRINVLGNSQKSKIKKLNTLQPSKKAAFTLAEVLVTLGVIGVVAAMTLPTLIQNYKKTAYVNQLKKSYSLLEQAFQKMLADDEVQKLSDTSVWATINDVSVWPNDFFVTDDKGKNFIANLGKYLRIIGVEQFGEDRYRLQGTKLPDDWKNDYAIALSDGTMIFLSPTSTITTKECSQIKELGGNMCSYAGSIEIDVNGRRRPNTRGRDQFRFSISDEGKLYPFSGKDEALFEKARPIESNGEYWKNLGNCGTPEGDVSDAKGDGCAARIIENGWKMDY